MNATHHPVNFGKNPNQLGQIGEKLTHQDLVDRGYHVITEQAETKIPGTNKYFKPDFIAVDPHGNLVLVESKMGQGAKFTPNQLIGYDHYANGKSLVARSAVGQAKLDRLLEDQGISPNAQVSRVEVYRWNSEIAPDAGLGSRAGVP